MYLWERRRDAHRSTAEVSHPGQVMRELSR